MNSGVNSRNCGICAYC
uniref:Uncharacterized protein n=1 Tax=Macrostomum lignano TaxID=282301 RepID=A0A1I8F5W7_9PLAT